MTTILDLIDVDRPAAHIRFRRRSLHWRIDNPGTLHANRFEMAWIQLEERQPMRGEPLWVTAHRRTGTDLARERFTDTASDKIHRTLAPVFARDFNDRWERAHQAQTNPRGAIEAAAKARARAEWHDRQAELVELWSLGLLGTRAHEPDETGFLPTGHRVVVPSHYGTETVDALADLLLDGEHVGWLTERGPIPTGDLP